MLFSKESAVFWLSDELLNTACSHRLLHLWLLWHGVEPEAESVLGAPLSSHRGKPFKPHAHSFKKKRINKVCSKIIYFGLKIFHLDHHWQEIMKSFHLCKKSSSCTNRPQTNWAPKPYTSTPVTSTDMRKTKYPSFLSKYKEQVREEQRDNHSSVTTPHPPPPPSIQPYFMLWEGWTPPDCTTQHLRVDSHQMWLSSWYT